MWKTERVIAKQKLQNCMIMGVLLNWFLSCYAVISKPNGPTPNSEFEHSSIPATIKKMFNLSSNFLTHRDAWAGTFEQVVGELTSPRTDCPREFPPRSLA